LLVDVVERLCVPGDDQQLDVVGAVLDLCRPLAIQEWSGRCPGSPTIRTARAARPLEGLQRERGEHADGVELPPAKAAAASA
jgi:hypothetical protein